MTEARTSRADRLADEYVGARPDSTALQERAAGIFPARGATHFTRVGSPFRPYIVRAQGSRKWDVDGNEYIDYVMGHGALVLGHGHPAIVEAVRRQAELGIHYGDNHPLEVEWGERIRRLMPAAERIELFACGQEANAMAIRLARAFTGRRRVLRFTRNYHGWLDELTAPGSPGAVTDLVTVIPANDLAALDRELATGEYALVMVEGGGGYLSGRVPTTVEFFQALPEAARRHGTVFLLDEVVTGFREAPGGWQSVTGIRPDLTSIGKAVSGGLPCGGLLGRADLMAAFDPSNAPDRLVTHGGTWNAVPLTCAAGIAACDTYVGGAPQRLAAERAADLRRLGNELLRELDVPGRLYARSVVHIYFGPCDPTLPVDGPPSRDPARLANPAAGPIHRRLALHLLQRGVASMRGEAFVLSAAHTERDIEETVSALRASILAMLEEGSLPAG